MPVTVVSFSDSAISDLEALKDWYAEQGAPDVGKKFVKDILDKVEALGGNPDMGRIVPEFDQPAIRELIHRPFRVVYRREPNKVSVVRVWRTERLLTLPPNQDE